MPNKPTTVKQYMAELPADRRAALSAVREVIIKNLGEGYAEGMSYGMPGFFVPHSLYPAGYHTDPRQPLPFASIASQKSHMAIYLMATYMKPGEEAWLRAAWAKTGKKLDMGKSCIRFKKLEDVALEVVGEAIRRVPSREYIALYEANLPGGSRAKNAASKTEAAKTASKTAAKAVSKPAAKAVSKTAVSKPAVSKPAAKAAAKAVSKPAVSKPAAKAAAKAVSKPAA
ncbi:MAG: DUF1801 domain-containing protein, partial [Bryobacterales bacterium]|nr:DUF1801 domain-containing protein [Bryobacterales bacterium]